jgi:hypothetical protein
MSILQARNEAVLDAPISKIWAIITDIGLLPRINPGVVSVTGTMNEPDGTRTCEILNNGRKGSVTEKLIEFVPGKRTVWKVETDTMGISRMLRDTRFSFILEKVTDSSTRVTAETHYSPATFLARIMNGLMMKKKFAEAQEQILQNLGTLAQNR